MECNHRQTALPDTESVYQLVTHLCKSLLKENGSNRRLKKARSIAFGILLKKTPAAFDEELVNHFPGYDPLLDLATLQFAVSRPKASQLKDILQQLDSVCECSRDLMKNGVHLVLALANLAELYKEDFVCCELGLGKLDDEFYKENPRGFPQYDPRLFVLPPVEKFICTRYGLQCPYLPPGGWYPFNEPPGTGLTYFNIERNPDVVPYDIPEFPELKGPKDLFLSEDSKKHDRQTPDEGYETPAAETAHSSPIDKVKEGRFSPKLADFIARIKHRTWETYGSRIPPIEKPLLCEVPGAVHRLWFLRLRQRAVTKGIGTLCGASELKVLKREELLHHLRYLLDGIRSSTFPYDEEFERFTTAPNICIEGICPDTIGKFLSIFLEVGTMVYHMQIIAQSPPKTSCIAYKAVCDVVREYLWLYRRELLRSELKNLLSIANSLRNLKLPQLSCIARFLSQKSICTADMLSQLNNAAVRDVNSNTAPLLVAMLRAGSSTYFKILEDWLFEGKLNDCQEEFFVCANPTASISRNQGYWKKAFFINKMVVPQFLAGLKEEILDCGRAIHLLRICCPKNPLLQELDNGYPHLRFCATMEQLQQLENECCKYEERVSAACGFTGGLTARDILLQCCVKNINLAELASDSRQQQEKRILDEMQQKNAQKRNEKKLQMEELEAHMAEVKQYRITEEKRLETEEKRVEQLSNHQKQQENILKEQEKQAIIQFYEELSNAADRRKFKAEWQMRRMKLNEKRKLFLSDNPIHSTITPPESHIAHEDTSQLTTKTNISVPQNYLQESNEANINNNNANEITVERCDNILDNIIPEIINNNKIADGATVNNIKSIEADKLNENFMDSDLICGSNNESHHITTVQVYNNNSKNEQFDNKNDQIVIENEQVDNKNKQNNVNNLCNDSAESPVSMSGENNEVIAQFGVATDLKSNPQDLYGLDIFNRVHHSFSFEMPNIPPYPIRDILHRFIGNASEGVESLEIENEDALQRSVLLPLQCHSRLVNGALLKYFLVEESLVGHLESLRNYFLLQDGEFSQLLSTQLFQGVYESVCPAAGVLNVFTLNRILAHALDGSSQAERDVNSSRLCFSLSAPPPRHFSRTSPDIFSSLVLGYSVQWPLCLILNDPAVEMYNRAFGFLLKVRYVAWVLEQNFKVLRLPAQYTRYEHHRIHLCRHEMMQFVHGLQSYIMSTVLQGSWVEFEAQLGRAVSLDNLYRFHARYVMNILYKCLAFQKAKEVMDRLMNIFSLILKFCEMVRSGIKIDSVLKTFYDYQKTVSRWLQFASLMSESGFQPILASLVLGLNVSGYYKSV